MGLLSTIGAASGRAFGFTRSAIAAATDAFFNQVTLLLPGNGTNGAQNNTFLDSSTNNFTITRNGNTTQGTFSPFSQTGWSNYFLNTGSQNLSAVTGADTSPGTGDFCAELWYWSTTTSGNYGLFGNIESNTDTQWGILLIQGSSLVRFQGWNTTFVSGTEPARNAWNHVAVCRSGTTMSMFINGTRAGTATVSNNFSATTNIRVGGPNGVDYFTGYISNARFVKGSSVYDPSQTSITVPTSPLTAITNTKFLTCQNNRFVDNSSTGYAITPNGTPSVQAFSPFAPTAAYSAATVGGSGYFDGSGDCVSVADSTAFTLGSGDFTIECWVYSTLAAQRQFIAGQMASNGANSSAPFSIEKTVGNKLVASMYSGATQYAATSSADITLNAWTHIAFVRDGNTLRQYINGVQDGTVSVTGITANDSSNNLSVGRAGEYALVEYFGYVANFRLVKGTCLYTSGTTFTPPTSPLTAITNTSLLANFTNAGITDATAKNVLETVGNAQISTTQSKFGGSSMYFDGAGDQLVMPASENFEFGSGNFTVECWVYITGTSGSIINYSNGQSGNSNFCWELYQLSSTNIQAGLVEGATVYTALSTSFTLNAWNHIAAVRNGNTLTIYVNGTAGGTTANVTNVSISRRSGVTVKVSGYNNATGMITGYIDDLRITKGYARYTANFTPPTAALPLQ